jgi:hypothetical protein
VPKTSPQKGGGGYGGGGYGGGASSGSAPSSSASSGSGCAACHQNIVQGEAVTVSGARYHALCFKCAICQKEIKGSFFNVKGKKKKTVCSSRCFESLCFSGEARLLLRRLRKKSAS